MWLISMSSGYMDTEQHYNLCICPTRVPSAPLWSSTVDDEFDLYIEELPVWNGEQKDPLS